MTWTMKFGPPKSERARNKRPNWHPIGTGRISVVEYAGVLLVDAREKLVEMIEIIDQLHAGDSVADPTND